MAQTTKKKRLLPMDFTDRPDSEVAENLFGKQAKRELDRLSAKNPGPRHFPGCHPKAVNKPTQKKDG